MSFTTNVNRFYDAIATQGWNPGSIVTEKQHPIKEELKMGMNLISHRGPVPENPGFSPELKTQGGPIRRDQNLYGDPLLTNEKGSYRPQSDKERKAVK